MSAVATAEQEKDAPAAEPEKEPGNRRRLILLAAPAILAALLAGLWFSGVLPRLLGLRHVTQSEAPKPRQAIYVDLPEMVANLNGSPRRPSYVKLSARLEVARPEDVDLVHQAMPRLQDLFQTYLREMRPEELRGSGGTYRLREELIARANAAAAPAHVTDVLFIQMLVQ